MSRQHNCDDYSHEQGGCYQCGIEEYENALGKEKYERWEAESARAYCSSSKKKDDKKPSSEWWKDDKDDWWLGGKDNIKGYLIMKGAFWYAFVMRCQGCYTLRNSGLNRCINQICPKPWLSYTSCEVSQDFYSTLDETKLIVENLIKNN